MQTTYEKNIQTGGELLEKGIAEYQPVNDWKKPIKTGESYNDPWMERYVDPVNLVYRTKALQVGFGIMAKGHHTRVMVEVPLLLWSTGISRAMISNFCDQAMKLCDFCWNNHIFTPEGAESNINIILEPTA